MDSCCMVGKKLKCTNIHLGLQLAQTTTVSLVMQQIENTRQLVGSWFAGSVDYLRRRQTFSVDSKTTLQIFAVSNYTGIWI
jgi:hypothetical protein